MKNQSLWTVWSYSERQRSHEDVINQIVDDEKSATPSKPLSNKRMGKVKHRKTFYKEIMKINEQIN
ncbi:MAG: hypothetical protein ACLR13_04475 [Acutalibacteraceae bacterium]